MYRMYSCIQILDCTGTPGALYKAELQKSPYAPNVVCTEERSGLSRNEATGLECSRVTSDLSHLMLTLRVGYRGDDRHSAKVRVVIGLADVGAGVW
jgi:hypothetical protein